jgi:hypothetical protein
MNERGDAPLVGYPITSSLWAVCLPISTAARLSWTETSAAIWVATLVEAAAAAVVGAEEEAAAFASVAVAAAP